MGFLYRDITNTGTGSNQYEVSIKGIPLGILIKQGNTWFVMRDGSNKYEIRTFLNQQDASKHLAELAGIDWRC